MYSHAPKNYICPFCELGEGKDSSDGITRSEHIIYHDINITAFVSSSTWPNNVGNVLVIPNQHFENIYEISDEAIAQTYIVAKKIALAMKEAYHCDAVSTRQHNEPDGNQNVWHFHVHVLPRYKNDKLYQNHDKKRKMTDKERKESAEKLRKSLL